MNFWSKIATLELALLILSPNGALARQTFWEIVPAPFEQAHLSRPTVLAFFSIHSICFCSFTMYVLHFAFMFVASCIHVLSSTCVSFHFHDPRSGMFSPMSVKRILNAEGTAFTWMLSTREQLYFFTTGTNYQHKPSTQDLCPEFCPALCQPLCQSLCPAWLHLFLRYCWCTCYCTCWCTRGLQYGLKVFP